MEYDKETFKAECNRRRNENLIVKGKTYEIKDQIKELGGIWDSKEKQWLMPDQGAVATCHAAMGLGDGPPPVPAPTVHPNENEAAAEQALSSDDDDLPF